MFDVIRNQRGEVDLETVGGIISVSFFGLIIWGVVAFLSGESEGIVKYDDCRQTIKVEQGSWDTYFKKFTCNDNKSKSGRLISGTCVHIDTSGGACVTAYVYEKKSEFNCGDNATPNYDDSVYSCTCNDGYHVDPKNHNLCILAPGQSDNPFIRAVNNAGSTLEVTQTITPTIIP